MRLGEKINRMRKAKKLSQSDMAEAVGVSRDAISKYERDDIVPSVENARRIAQVLGVSLDYLVSDKEEQEVIDTAMLDRMREIQQLTDTDQTTILQVIDAFIRDTKAKRAYAQ